MAQRVWGSLLMVASLALLGLRESTACTPLPYPEKPRYVGGNLIWQLAKKAQTIQIARAVARRPLTPSDPEFYDWNGLWPAPFPDWHYEYETEIVELEVLETIKGDSDGNARALSPRWSSVPTDWSPPETFWEVLIEEPNPALGLFAARGDGFYYCMAASPLSSDRSYLIVRDELGLIAYEQVQLSAVDGNGRSFDVPAPVVIPIAGAQDPFLRVLRLALDWLNRPKVPKTPI